jgi:hypothetical protein
MAQALPGGESIYGAKFADESFALKHTGPGKGSGCLCVFGGGGELGCLLALLSVVQQRGLTSQQATAQAMSPSMAQSVLMRIHPEAHRAR